MRHVTEGNVNVSLQLQFMTQQECFMVLQLHFLTEY
jgi:hypothetical protein